MADVELKALRPFTEFISGYGMVVFNEGSVCSLPSDYADRRIQAGFAERTKKEKKAEPESTPAVTPPVVKDAPEAATKAVAARRGRPPAAKARQPRTAATTDAPVD